MAGEMNLRVIDTLKVVSNISTLDERYYFSSHIKNVSLTAKTLGEKSGMSDADIQRMVSAIVLFGIASQGAPHKFVISDPNDFYSIEDRNLYFERFFAIISSISRIDYFRSQGTILSQIWEHYDATGLPGMISGNQIIKESQIIALAKMYHNYVYSVPLKLKDLYEEKGTLLQSPEVTQARHDEFLKVFIKRPKWFDHDLFQEFTDLVRRKKCASLIPIKHELRVKAYLMDLKRPINIGFQPTVDLSEEEDSKEIDSINP